MLKKLILMLLTILNISSFADDKDDKDIKKISESIGHMIGKNLDDLGIELDIKQLVEGIKKASDKKISPMDEKECVAVLNKIQTKVNKQISAKNLKIANDFLQKNAKNKEITELEKNKLQYKIIKNGKKGSLKPYHTPIVNLQGRYMNGKVFTKMEESLILSETLPSLQKAIIGMKENEKRRIFIHPKLFYDEDKENLGLLVIFDVEIINLDTKEKPLDHIANQNTIF
ncbi:MAG: Peptidyl-prolyl cis-trans isomerase Mip [Candidatus Anoxychlamydiales bacterium]|nr:Peptidyl-prolyl cis-trans isomerase Mip [Candidatus Anoxychlamydiales bacterium]NGX36240.1 Peptidyl-prolyl cis-trans isomerase Mip [Candidatus Anoxychlamydiales bacterium]